MTEALNPIAMAEKNLKEAQRQYEDAVKAHAGGSIDEKRLEQFARLRDAAVEDIARVRREF